MNTKDKEVITNTARAILAAALGAFVVFSATVSNSAQAAPNYTLAKGTVACKGLAEIGYVERLMLDERVTPEQKTEVHNSCTTLQDKKDLTAWSIGNGKSNAKVEIFALGKLDVYYVNTRDLKSLSEDHTAE